MGWAILDAEYSSDQRFLAYSGWSPHGTTQTFPPRPTLSSFAFLLLFSLTFIDFYYYYYFLVHLCNVGEASFETHEALQFG